MKSIKTTISIIGAGPAGLTCAIQLQRYGVPFMLIEKVRAGGLLWNANLVENYPGFPAGVSGPKLIHLFEKQAERIGVEIRRDEIVSLDWEGDGFIARGLDAAYQSEIMVIASGTKPRPAPVVIPDSARDRVFSDVVPLLGVREKQVIIVGAGDAAFDHALNLTKKGNSVTILNRGKIVKCLGLLKMRAEADSAITYRTGMPVSRVEVDENGSRLKVWCDASECLGADYLIFAIGRDPQDDFVSASVREKEDELKLAGRLYFIGDVQNGLLRQTAIAAGDGLRAAMQIYYTLEDGSL